MYSGKIAVPPGGGGIVGTLNFSYMFERTPSSNITSDMEIADYISTEFYELL
jgi:hypothetical protein